MQQLLTDRLVTIIFSPLDGLAAWCGQVGLEAHRTADGSVIISNPHFNFTTAIYDGLDPISRAACLASAVAGPHFWPEIFPGLLDAVNKEWKVRHRQEKTRQKWEKTEASVIKTPDSEGVRQPTFETLYKRA